MNYSTTKSTQVSVPLSQCLLEGLASDGGLYIPKVFPHIGGFGKLTSIGDIGQALLTPFFQGDELEKSLRDILDESFNFPVQLKSLTSNLDLLELFHGPTQSFKDFGARFLAACLKRIPTKKPRMILVATSGDTGGAVASAFEGLKDHSVVLLFPELGISPRQKHQLTCWGSNVRSFAVQGTFDDCQRMVKETFASSELKSFSLTSSNSINIGRLLPQMVYYAWASQLVYGRSGNAANFVIPSGNVGNATACFWARKVGLPINHIRMAFNANATVTEYFKSGTYTPQKSKKTLANAMDVGAPSNLERLIHLDELKKASSTSNTPDPEIKKTILSVRQKYGITICPHTACGFHSIKDDGFNIWTVLATAHPAKFNDVIEPILGESVQIPESLGKLLSRPVKVETIPPSTEELISILKR